MRARCLLFPCASVVFLLAIPCVAFVFWTSRPPTVELPWMRWAFLASAAMLPAPVAPTLGVVVIDERGVRVRTLFKSALIPWQDVRQVGKPRWPRCHPEASRADIFISRVRQPWAKDKYLPRLYRCFWRRKDGEYTQNVLNFKARPRWKRPSAAIGQENGSTCCPRVGFPRVESLRRSSSAKRRSPWTMYPSGPQGNGVRAGSRNLTNPPRSSIIGTIPNGGVRMRQCMDADNLHRRLKKSSARCRPSDRMVDEMCPARTCFRRSTPPRAPCTAWGRWCSRGIYSTACATASSHGDAEQTIASFTKAVERFANMK